MTYHDERLMDEVLNTALSALDAGLVSTEQVRRANAWRRKMHPQLGKLAMAEGKLSVAQVFDILGHQAVEGGLFGRIAVSLGFLTEKDLFELLQIQTKLSPSMADALVALEFIGAERMAALLDCDARNSRRDAPCAGACPL